MIKLRKPASQNIADQCREMGVSTGDIILGIEKISEKWWSESKLKLIFMGKQVCVFETERRNIDFPEWEKTGESSNWTLDYREWYKLKPEQSTGLEFEP